MQTLPAAVRRGSEPAGKAAADGAADWGPRTLDGFVALHYRRLVRLAALVCLDRSEAQDAVQNALLRAWRSRRGLRDPSRVKPWLDAIVVRESIRLNERRASWLRRLVAQPSEPAARAASIVSAERLDLAASLRSLPAPQRAVVALHYEVGYTVAEIAELMGTPHETIRSRLRLARRRLRHELADEAEEVE